MTAKDTDAVPPPLLGERVLVGVTGSPSAITMPQYILMMRQTLARQVRVMMSRSAQRFVRPYALRLFVGDWVYTDTDQITDEALVPHIDLTTGIDLFLIMPATANILGKAANGICDDLISTSIIACEAPVVFVPAMNGVMWQSSAVQRNVDQARAHGYHVIEPSIGVQLADLTPASGVMPPLEHILDQLLAIVTSARRPKEAKR